MLTHHTVNLSCRQEHAQYKITKIFNLLEQKYFVSVLHENLFIAQVIKKTFRTNK